MLQEVGLRLRIPGPRPLDDRRDGVRGDVLALDTAGRRPALDAPPPKPRQLEVGMKREPLQELQQLVVGQVVDGGQTVAPQNSLRRLVRSNT